MQRKVQGLSDHQRAATTLTQDKIRARYLHPFSTQGRLLHATLANTLWHRVTQAFLRRLCLSTKELCLTNWRGNGPTVLHCRPERITLQGMDFMGLDDEIAGGALLEEALQSLDDIGNPVVQSPDPCPLSAGSQRTGSILGRFSSRTCWLETPLLSQVAACIQGIPALKLEHAFPGHVIAACTPHDVHDMLLNARKYAPPKSRVVHPRLPPGMFQNALLRQHQLVCAARSRSIRDAITRA